MVLKQNNISTMFCFFPLVMSYLDYKAYNPLGCMTAETHLPKTCIHHVMVEVLRWAGPVARSKRGGALGVEGSYTTLTTWSNQDAAAPFGVQQVPL